MKKRLSLLLITAAAATFLTACARGAQSSGRRQESEPQVQTGDAVSEEESTDGSGDAATLPDLTESRPVAYAPCVRVNGVIYQDTGFLSSMVGCGNMDGKITTSVESTQLPAKDDESQFRKRVWLPVRRGRHPACVLGRRTPLSSGMWILWNTLDPGGGTAFHG